MYFLLSHSLGLPYNYLSVAEYTAAERVANRADPYQTTPQEAV